MMNTISILGSTGSIGRQTLDVAEQLGLRVAALTANSNVERMEAQCRKFRPRLAVMTEEAAAKELAVRLQDTSVKVLAGTDALVDAAVIPEVETVVTAVVGMVGLKATLAAIREKKRIALANKETLVCAGELVMSEADRCGAEIVPVDSEHSAIFQCLQGCRDRGEVRLDVGASRIGTKIFEARDVSKRFGDVVILDKFNYNFTRYEKLGIVGDNGCGKSTLLKLLTGIERPDSGVIDIGETVRFGYYSQQGLEFDDSMRVIDVVTAIAEQVELGDGRRMSASQLLQHFLFTPETQYNYVARLSGGERRRLYLCTVLMQSPNFLVLDEPTNDLDIVTLGILEEYLQAFRGCVIVVSHDRYFVDKVADHLLVFCGGGEIRDFAGTYSEYVAWKREYEAARRTEAAQARPKPQAAKTQAAEAVPRKLSFNEKRELEALETEIPALEAEKAALEASLSSGTLPVEELTAQSRRIAELIASIDEKTMRWLELSER